MNHSGNTKYHGTRSVTIKSADYLLIPETFALKPAYPNPFNPVTTIQYELHQRSDIQITIFNLQGREVITLVNRHEEAGYKTIQWDVTNVPSGMYFYQIKAGDFHHTKKMLLLK